MNIITLILKQFAIRQGAIREVEGEQGCIWPKRPPKESLKEVAKDGERLESLSQGLTHRRHSSICEKSERTTRSKKTDTLRTSGREEQC